MKRISRLLAAAATASLAACTTLPGGPVATATLSSTTGNKTAGSVRFAQQSDGRVLVSGEIQGLKANAEHGFHIHEKGDCSSGDGMSAGGHFNPKAQPHGRHDAAARHAGDLQPLRADASGVARFSFESTGISVGPGAADVVGRGLVVHRDPDDHKAQPMGNTGPRLACAVIVRG
ncbi:superoxide dismutase family protein [Ramlibacter sp. XY19]|uniref:superoxide dismutase family protein n=1 Tax=Ramlibacter paludis TaxID=2908000 RepID=UPI0023DCD9CE|nr:superoxide dismutase family protein [Ramlibacter paludis]MCG2594179.1 superoxide dismutase family protein [Ramlibacter paludis]